MSTFKIVLVDEDERYFHMIKAICQDLDIPSYPNTVHQFNKFRSASSGSLKQGILEDVIAERKKFIHNELSNFTGNDDALYLIDDELFEGATPVTGKDFYYEYAEGKPCLLISSLVPAWRKDFQRFADRIGTEILWKDEPGFKELLILKLKQYKVVGLAQMAQ